jgi:hypothetical protein
MEDVAGGGQHGSSHRQHDRSAVARQDETVPRRTVGSNAIMVRQLRASLVRIVGKCFG